MRNRSTWLAAALVPLATSLLAAQTFDQTVGKTLSKDGALRSEADSLKMSVEKSNGLLQDWQVLEPQQTQAEEKAQAFDVEFGIQRGPGGGHPPSPRPPSPRPPSPRPPSPRPPSPRPPSPRPPSPRPPHPGPNPHPRPPHPGHPGNPGRPGHRPPHEGDHHGDWHRWPGHPGWGHRWGRWEVRNGYWWWWGWVVWRGERRAECLGYYDSLHTQCNGACEDEQLDCADSCGGDADCVEQCELNSDYCYDGCQMQYENEVATCPAWLTAR